MTKKQAVLNCLRRAGGRWVSLHDLMIQSASGAVHSVIADLRKRGHQVENRLQHDRRGLVARSFYRLVRPEWESPPPPVKKEAPEAAQHTARRILCHPWRENGCP